MKDAESDDPLWVVVYTSAAAREMDPDELRTMLVGARRRNRARGVTGVLVYHDRMFMQAMEGPRSVVQALLSTISLDERHRGLLVMLNEAASARRFTDHAMAFRNITGDPLPEGFSDLLHRERDAALFGDSRDRVHRLLTIFADTIRRR